MDGDTPRDHAWMQAMEESPQARPARHTVDRCDTALWDCGGVTVVWRGQPADYRDDELELVDDSDLELDLLDDLCDRDED